MNKKNLTLVLLVLASVLAGLFLGNSIAQRAQIRDNNSVLKNIFSVKPKNKIGEVLNLIDKQYVDTVNSDSITEELMIDLIAKLDPHSVYIPAKELETVNSELEGSFSGIGVQFNIQNDTVMIISVISGGPSEKVGLMAGDRIVSVNDTAFTGKSVTNERVMKKLRGPAKTKVTLGVKRNGTSEILKFTITRGEIPVNSIDIAYMIEKETGFIKVNKFAATTYSEFLNAIAKLRAEGAQKYIIDLRENSGGLMDQAIIMVNEFLPAGNLIVYAQGKAYPRFDAKSDGKGSCIKNQVVVLIDEFSASASEIFAGAIQDNDRGIIIGRRSFGKGLVQQQMPLSDGSALRLTVARYYTPSGRSIQKPYERGKTDDYDRDLMERFLHGEFFNVDSIHNSDSLVYKTKGGKTVFGGGGIMPDIFVARDTSQYSSYLTKIINYGYLYQFAFKYTDQNRENLKNYKNWKDMKSYLEKQNLLDQFVKFAQTKGVIPNNSELNVSKNYILHLLHAYISRNILGDDGFYPIYFQKDETVIRALNEIRKLK